MRRHALFPLLATTAFAAVIAALATGSPALAQQAGAESPPADPPAQAVPRDVRLIRLRLPLTGSDDAAYQARLQRAVDQLTAGDAAPDARRPLLVLQFDRDPDGGATEYERALRLARLLVSDQMTRVKTLAYLPDSIEGHAVLVALACEEIAMAPDAQLGRAGADEDAARPIEQGILASYRQIAEARRTAPTPVAVAMVDRSAELVRLETDRGVEYALGDQLEALREERAIVSEDLLAPAGTLAVFSGREAREQGTAKYLAADREALARALGVSVEVLLEDESLGGEWRPVMVDLDGPVTNRSVRRLESLLGDELERNDVNWVGVRINSAGGEIASAIQLSQTLAELGDGEVRTVAYVPRRAEGPAALVALACDQLVMQSGSTLVGLEPLTEEPDEQDADGALKPPVKEDEDAADAAQQEDEDAAGAGVEAVERFFGDPEADLEAAEVTIRATIAPETARTWSLLVGALDAQIELAEYSNRQSGATRVFSPEELEEQEEPGAWRRGALVKAAGEPLKLDADAAEELGVAWRTVDQFDDLEALYGLAEPPRTAEPNWALELVEALASPGLAALLLIVGIIGLYIELNTPGLGIGGFIASVALLLFFWSKFLDGTADWLEVLLFVAGVVFLLIEIFVIPGFGIFGLGGALLVIGSLVLASQTFILPKTESQLVELRNSLATIFGAGFGTLLLGAALRYYLPESFMFRALIDPPMEAADRIEQDRRERLADYEHLVGKPGTATTDLLPAGRAEIDGEPIDVLTRGELINRGEAIEVVEARANRVIVRRVNS